MRSISSRCVCINRSMSLEQLSVVCDERCVLLTADSIACRQITQDLCKVKFTFTANISQIYTTSIISLRRKCATALQETGQRSVKLNYSQRKYNKVRLCSIRDSTVMSNDVPVLRGSVTRIHAKTKTQDPLA